MWGYQTILCVENDPTIRRTQALILSAAGYDVLTAADADEAIQKLASKHIDLILLEARADASLVADEARRRNRRTLVLLCTADFNQPDAPWANYILYKPTAPPHLLRTVAALIAERQAIAA